MNSQLFRRIAILVSFCATCAYFVIRTLGIDSPRGDFGSLLMWGLYTAEVHGAVLLFSYFYQVWNTRKIPTKEPLEGRTVDVFLPTYNEDAQLVRGTIQALLAIEYPHRVYVLDDGQRDEIRALAESMGAEYIARDENIHAKAGNINHALEQTSGEFVAIFDADHIPSKRFLHQTLGFFRDPEVAFVQTPHAFYNFRSFCSSWSSKATKYWEEGTLFHRMVQTAKTHANANIFCGSSAVFRRAALEDVGLIATETITEDMHTGLRLHANGWKSIGIPDRLVAAQAAHDLSTYQTQRLRWCEGNMSILWHDNPLTMPGLSVRQRLHYLGSLAGWTAGFSRTVMYAIPVLVLLTGTAPVRMTPLLLSLCALHVTMAWLALKISGGGYFSLIHSELSAMSMFWLQVRGCIRALLGSDSGFVVTSKRGRQGAGLLARTLPQWTVAGGSIFSLAWFMMACLSGAREASLLDSIACALALIQFVAAAAILVRSFSKSDGRYSYRHHSGAVPVDVEVPALNEKARSFGPFRMVVVNCNEMGVMLRGNRELPEGCEIHLRIGSSSSIECRGSIKWRKLRWQGQFKRRSGEIWDYGVLLQSLEGKIVDRLWQLSIGHVAESQHQRIENSSETRGKPHSIQLPVVIGNCSKRDTEERGTTMSMDRKSIRFESDREHLLSGRDVSWMIDTPFGESSGTGTLRPLGQQNNSHTYELVDLSYEGQSRAVKDLTLEFYKAPAGRRLGNHIEPNPGNRKCYIPVSVATASLALAISSYCIINPAHVIAAIPQFSGQLPSFIESRFQELVRNARDAQINEPSVLLSLRRSLTSREMHQESDDITLQLNRVLPDNHGIRIAAADVMYSRMKYEDSLALLREDSGDTFALKDVWRHFRVAAALQDLAVTDRFLKRLLSADTLSADEVRELSGICLKMGLAHTHGRACVRRIQRQTLHDETSTEIAMELLLALNDPGGARAAGEAYLSTADSRKVQLLMTRADYGKGAYEDCVQRLSRIGGITDQKYMLIWAESLLQLGKVDESISLWPGDPQDAFWHLHVLRCGIAMMQGSDRHRNPEIEAACNQVITLAVENKTPSMELAEATAAYLAEFGPAGVVDYISSLALTSPNQPALRLRLANALFQSAKYDNCIKVASDILQVSSPEDDHWCHAALLIARSHQREGRASLAMAHFEQILTQQEHTTVDLGVELAGIALENKEPQLALSLLEKCQLNPSPIANVAEHSPSVKPEAAEISNEDISPDEATVAVQGTPLQSNTIRSDTRVNVASYRLAALAQLGRWDDVRKQYESRQMNQLATDAVDLLYAESLLTTGNASDAKGFIQKQFSMVEPAAKILMGRVLVSEGNSQSALSVLGELREEQMSDSAAFAMMEAGYDSTMQEGGKSSLLLRACQLVHQYGNSPMCVSPELPLEIAEFLRHAGENQMAISLIMNKGLHKTSAKGLSCLAESLRDTNQTQLAMSQIEEWSDNNGLLMEKALSSASPDGSSARLRLVAARCAMDVKKYDLAREHYSQLPPDKLSARGIQFEMASATLAAGDGEGAVRLLRPIDTFEAKKLLAEAYILAGQAAKSIALCKNLSEENSNGVSHLATLARACYATGNKEECLASWSQLADRRPLSLDECVVYASHLVWMDHCREALSVFEHCLTHSLLPETANGALISAVTSVPDSGERSAAYVHHLIRQSQKFPEKFDLATHEAVARGLMRQRRFSEAVPRAKLLLLIAPDSSVHQLLLLDALHGAGMYEEAQGLIGTMLSSGATAPFEMGIRTAPKTGVETKL
jgi:cellulose synthase/poly-beta-1,6-N-acetylglucosamine synthase-like glycosyltransferase/tetratricopeptide (TPR) repeat protein